MKLQHYSSVNLIGEDRAELSESNRLLFWVSLFLLFDLSEHKKNKTFDILNVIKYFRGSCVYCLYCSFTPELTNE